MLTSRRRTQGEEHVHALVLGPAVVCAAVVIGRGVGMWHGGSCPMASNLSCLVLAQAHAESGRGGHGECCQGKVEMLSGAVGCFRRLA